MTQANRLRHETSPYLQQHADNPVDWYPWGQEALERARSEDKPILLSIGYSACHWCHVMAHECFEDPDTAALMNERFVNIKVDREERPDLDKIYQLAHQLLTQRAGGWPLNTFLTPREHLPIFGGTYFPKEPRYGLPAFAEILQRVADFYDREKDAVARHNASLRQTLTSSAAPAGVAEERLDPALLDQARRDIGASFDPRHGGFGEAPKFPRPTTIEFLLRHWAASRGTDLSALHMAAFTLEKMAEGGIYDHLGGGFCRYSVDDEWMIPHFEKMLYDNAALLALYSDAWQATQTPLFRTTAIETAEWVMREMQAADGGYFSSIDADSEGHEGKFYVWTRAEVESLLDGAEQALFEARYGLDGRANFEGKWHLRALQSIAKVAETLGLSEDEAQRKIEAARHKLFRARAGRVHPGRDEKILTSWNALMIKGMATAGRIFERLDFIASAATAYDFVHAKLWRNGRLLATYKDGKAHLNAYLDDYAFLLDASIELLQARWRSADPSWALALAEVLLEHFQDTANGGFFFTSDDHESLIQRLKPLVDEATPSGNALAALALARLGHLLGEQRFIAAAERALKGSLSSVKRVPQAHAGMLSALQEILNPPEVAVIRGALDETAAWQRAALAGYHPGRLCFAIPDDAGPLPALLSERQAAGGTTAYLCTAGTCLPPVTTLSDWRQLLEKAPSR